VNRWKAIIALLLATCYLPATGHCLLEQAGWFSEVDGCCEASAPMDSPPFAPCGDGCCAIERGGYASNPRTLLLTAPVAAVAPAPLAAVTCLAPVEKIVPVDSSPPELSRSWCFRFRTALPPRAPSFVS
jgi:hypothetical protein